MGVIISKLVPRTSPLAFGRKAKGGVIGTRLEQLKKRGSSFLSLHGFTPFCLVVAAVLLLSVKGKGRQSNRKISSVNRKQKID